MLIRLEMRRVSSAVALENMSTPPSNTPGPSKKGMPLSKSSVDLTKGVYKIENDELYDSLPQLISKLISPTSKVNITMHMTI